MWGKLDAEKMQAGLPWPAVRLAVGGPRGDRVSAEKASPPGDAQRGGWVINSWSDLQKQNIFGVG